MHEACWKRGEEPLKQEKQNLREKKKKSGGVCAAKLILQGLRRASDESSASTAAGVHFQELRMCILLSTLST